MADFIFLGYCLLSDDIKKRQEEILNYKYSGISRYNIFDSFYEHTMKQHELFEQQGIKLYFGDPIFYPEGAPREAYKSWLEYYLRCGPEWDIKSYFENPEDKRDSKCLKEIIAKAKTQPKSKIRSGEGGESDYIIEYDSARKIYTILKEGGIKSSFLKCELDGELLDSYGEEVREEFVGYELPDDHIRGKFLGYDVADCGGSNSELISVGPNDEYAKYLN